MSAQEQVELLRKTLGYASSSPEEEQAPEPPSSSPEASTSPGIPLRKLTASRRQPTTSASASTSPDIPLSELAANRDCSSPAKRKAAAPLEPTSPSKRSKQDSETPENAPPQPKKLIPFLEKPAEVEERTGEIEFRVVNNDGKRESTIILTGLKCIFQKQLPKMPKDYIARLVYDRTHLSIAIVKKPLEVVGYVEMALRYFTVGDKY